MIRENSIVCENGSQGAQRIGTPDLSACSRLFSSEMPGSSVGSFPGPFSGVGEADFSRPIHRIAERIHDFGTELRSGTAKDLFHRFFMGTGRAVRPVCCQCQYRVGRLPAQLARLLRAAAPCEPLSGARSWRKGN